MARPVCVALGEMKSGRELGRLGHTPHSADLPW